MVSLEALIITAIYLVDLFLLVPKYTRCKYDHTPRTRKLVWKGTCIGSAYAVLLFGAVRLYLLGQADVTLLLIVIGMTLCAVGDIVLEIRFLRGGLLFFGGHLVYVSALITKMEKLSIVAIVVYIILVFTGTFLTCTKLGKKYRYGLIAYNLAISGSFALSVPFIITGIPAFVLLGTGLCFLAISDWLLARNKTLGSTFGWSLISLVFYFGGQILISTYPYLLRY